MQSLRRTLRLRGPLRRPYGFTLVELLVVVMVIGLLVAMLLPGVQAAREAARRTACKNNLRQIGLALTLYSDHSAALPIGCQGCGGLGGRLTSWNTRLLPHLERRSLADAYDDTLPAYDDRNRSVALILQEFLCPSESTERLLEPSGLWRDCAYTDYGGVSGLEGVVVADESGDVAEQYLGVLVYDEAIALAEITDGLAHTVSVVELRERRTAEQVWTNGANLIAQESTVAVNAASGLGGDIGSPHPGGALAVYCDAHVEWLADDLDQSLLNAALTRAGGEAVR